jgi:hypothetical protein
MATNTYRLKYRDDGFGVAKEIEFEASDSAQALFFVQRETRGRKAELWRDGHPVCTLRRSVGACDFWEINAAW